MPYKTVSELPKSIKSSLPADAQRIWLRVFNDTHDKVKNDGRAAAAAWVAVKRSYKKSADGKWRKKAGESLAQDYQRMLAGLPDDR